MEEQLLEEKIQQYHPWLIWTAAAVLTLIMVTVCLVVGASVWEEAPEPTAATEEAITEEPVIELPQSPFADNPYGPEDFALEEGFLTCLAGESVLGIDVSSHQEEIDWNAVADAGVKFAMIRVGARGYGAAGVLFADDWAQINYEGAKAAGLQVGCYFFSQATNVEEAIEEAAFALLQIKDWELDLPIVFDWEYLGQDARTANVDRRTATDCALAFCKTVELVGYEAMTYFNINQAENHVYMEELIEYRGWLAMYSDQMTYPYKVDMWQYTDEGSIPGVNGPVDINLYFPY